MNSWLIHAGVERLNDMPLSNLSKFTESFSTRIDRQEIEKKRDIPKAVSNSPKARMVIAMCINGNSKQRIEEKTGFSREYIEQITEIAGYGRPRQKYGTPVLQFSQGGEFIAEYETSYAASKKLGITLSNIREVLVNPKKRKSAGGFIFKYKEEACNGISQ